jgi:hypothetical protein
MLGLMVNKFPEFPNYPATLEEPTPLATEHPFSPVGDPLNDAFEMSQLMDASDNDLLYIWVNGFGAVMTSTNKPQHQVVMTASRHSAFLESGNWLAPLVQFPFPSFCVANEIKETPLLCRLGVCQHCCCK